MGRVWARIEVTERNILTQINDSIQIVTPTGRVKKFPSHIPYLMPVSYDSYMF